MSARTDYSRKIAENLLQIGALKINVEQPFTWASGMRSPLYCDNRKTLYYPAVRKLICEGFVDAIKNQYGTLEDIKHQVDAVAGVATGAIAHGMLVAEALDLPYGYVRPTPKGHGLKNQVEGDFRPDTRVLVIEDLVSTGDSSHKAMQALSDLGTQVLGMHCIFSYQLPAAVNLFAHHNIAWDYLCNLERLLEVSIHSGYLPAHHRPAVEAWAADPLAWQQQFA